MFSRCVISGLIFLVQAIFLFTMDLRAEDSAQVVPRKFFGARLEPEKTVLHGAGQDFQGFQDYSALMGPEQKPVVYMTYTSVTRTLEHLQEWGDKITQEMSGDVSDSLVLQIGLNLTEGDDTGEGGDGRIAKGECDEIIDEFCHILKRLDRPAFVRIGYEFEGSWNGYKPDSFKKAWVLITRAMKKHKLNVATVWCSAGASAGDMPLKDRMAYYPGDEWVDWWGIDIFDAHESLSRETATFCAEAGKHRKPVMIGEATARYVGVLDGQKSWDKWYAPFFQLIRQQPEIKCFCYINWEWAEWSDRLGFSWHDWGDSRLEKNEVVAAHYLEEMKLPLYEHDRTQVIKSAQDTLRTKEVMQ